MQFADDKYTNNEINNMRIEILSHEKTSATTSPTFDFFLKIYFALLAYPMYEIDKMIESYRILRQKNDYLYIDEETGTIGRDYAINATIASAKRSIFTNSLRFQFLIRKYDSVKVPWHEIYESLAEKMVSEQVIFRRLRTFYSFVFCLAFLTAISLGNISNTLALGVLGLSAGLYLILLAIFMAVVWPVAKYKAKDGDLSREIINFELRNKGESEEV